MTRAKLQMGVAGLALAALVVFWPTPTVDVQPVLERRLQHPTESVTPLERSGRPPHPASIYLPPGR